MADMVQSEGCFSMNDALLLNVAFVVWDEQKEIWSEGDWDALSSEPV